MLACASVADPLLAFAARDYPTDAQEMDKLCEVIGKVPFISLPKKGPGVVSEQLRLRRGGGVRQGGLEALRGPPRRSRESRCKAPAKKDAHP